MNRRQFIQGCSAALGLAALQPGLLWGIEDNRKPHIFVQIFLRGGCDALNLLGPSTDRIYVDARPANLRVEDSGERKGWALGKLKNQDFFLHHQAKPLFELYQSRQLAFIQAAGLSHGTRSHFEAQDLIEKGLDKEPAKAQGGWLARYLQAKQPEGSIPALASGRNLPLAFLGSNRALALSKAEDFKLHADPRLHGILRSLYKSQDKPLDQAASRLLRHIEQVQNRLPREANGRAKAYEAKAPYPEEWYARDFSQKLQTLAQLLKMEVGLSVASLDFHGWDTHENQAGTFTNLVDSLSRGLQAFFNDVAAYQSRLTVVVLSEFGRRLKANKSQGTDHGFGGSMLVLGGGTKGGKLYGDWRGLDNAALDNGVDLSVTTDYRQVLAEVFRQKMDTNAELIFPGFKAQGDLGFI